MIEQLVEQIKKAQVAYYNGPEEIMLDEDYDRLVESLRVLDPTNPIFRTVGKDDSSAWQKCEHVIPMGSLDKVTTEADFNLWARKQNPTKLYNIEYKLDGASIEVVYKNGKLERAVTRGDGKVGDDITRNVLKMQNVQQQIPYPYTIILRGEILLSKNDFGRFPRFKNPRSAANGIMKRLDGKGCEYLVVVYYEIYGLSQEIRKKFNMFDPTIGHYQLNQVTYVRNMLIDGLRAALPYDIDGLVIKNLELPEYGDGPNPTNQIAFKFPADSCITYLRRIEWSLAGGTLTPVAIFDPIDIGGATITRASLYNVFEILRLGLDINKKIKVSRMGDVIPKIVESYPTPNTSYIVLPTKCPECGTKIAVSGARMYCPNEACKEKVIHKLAKWVEAVGIEELGPATLDLLYSVGVDSIKKLYELEIWEFINNPGMGEVKAGKIIESIQAHREITLPQLLQGFDMPSLGEKFGLKLVAAGIETIEDLDKVSPLVLSAIEGVGPERAAMFANSIIEHRAEMKKLVQSGAVSLKSSKPESTKLKGLSFCFTGELENMTRVQAEDLVRKNGGEVKSSVSSKLSYLVTNNPNSGSSKNIKAREELVDIINEEQFRRMI